MCVCVFSLSMFILLHASATEFLGYERSCRAGFFFSALREHFGVGQKAALISGKKKKKSVLVVFAAEGGFGGGGVGVTLVLFHQK